MDFRHLCWSRHQRIDRQIDRYGVEVDGRGQYWINNVLVRNQSETVTRATPRADPISDSLGHTSRTLRIASRSPQPSIPLPMPFPLRRRNDRKSACETCRRHHQPRATRLRSRSIAQSNISIQQAYIGICETRQCKASSPEPCFRFPYPVPGKHACCTSWCPNPMPDTG